MGLVRFAQPMQTLQQAPKKPFHGDNTGSNPVGDAKKIKNFNAHAAFKAFAGDSVVTK